MPLLSIGLPVYNGEKYLRDAIESIINQTFTDFELIISDNASTDRTGEICASYSRADSRVRYIRNKENLGAAVNYNAVFASARGKFFKWQAHDDMCAPDFFAKCVQVLDERPEYIICYPKTKIIDKQGAVVTMEEDDLRLDSPNVMTRFSSCLNPMKYCHNPIFGIMRSEVLAQTRLIGKFLASDRCLITELSLYGPFFEYPEKLFIRRKHESNIGRSYRYIRFYNPSFRGKFAVPELRLFIEGLISIRRSPLSSTQKAHLCKIMCQWAITKRRTILREVLFALKTIQNSRLRNCFQ